MRLSASVQRCVCVFVFVRLDGCVCLSGVLFHLCWLTDCVRAAWEMMFPPVTSHKDREGHSLVSLSFVSLAVHFFSLSPS